MDAHTPSLYFLMSLGWAARWFSRSWADSKVNGSGTARCDGLSSGLKDLKRRAQLLHLGAKGELEADPDLLEPAEFTDSEAATSAEYDNAHNTITLAKVDEALVEMVKSCMRVKEPVFGQARTISTASPVRISLKRQISIRLRLIGID